MSAWTDERIESLKQLWTDGQSCSQIARRLGGVTRNAVIGKVWRLGLPHRATPSIVPRMPRVKRIRVVTRPGRIGIATALFNQPPASNLGKPEPIPVPMEELFIAPEARKGLIDLEKDDCRWPIGTPGAADFHFCGHSKHDPLPYCEHHARRAYEPAKRWSDKRGRGTARHGFPAGTASPDDLPEATVKAA